MKLTIKQTKGLDILEDSVTEELLYGGAAGGAKSVLGCYWQLKRRYKYPGSRGFIGRAVFKTLKDTTLKTFFEVAQMQGLKRGRNFDLTGSWDKENPNCIMFDNGSLIFLRDLALYPTDPDFDELGSLEITDAFVDECGQVVQKAKDTLKIRIRYGLDRWNLIPKILYATNPVKTWPYLEFYRPSREGKLPEHRKYLPAFVYENPYAPAAYVASLEKMPEGPQKERLLRGNWEYDDDPEALIEYEKILDCFTNDFDSLKGRKYITSDLARLGGDKITIGEWDGWRVEITATQKQRLNISGAQIEQRRKQGEIPKSNVLCDDDGLGGGVVDYEGYLGFVNNSRPLSNPETGEDENYYNLRSQCYFRLAERINNGGLFIKCDDPDMRQKIIQELEWVKAWEMDKDGKRRIIPKEKVKEAIGRSPDFADTLMMREWFELSQTYSWTAM